MPLLRVREVVVKVTALVTVAVPERVKGAGGVQVTPVGAVPWAVQVTVTVPLKPAVGTKSIFAVPVLPATVTIEVDVLPSVKVGTGRPVPVSALV